MSAYQCRSAIVLPWLDFATPSTANRGKRKTVPIHCVRRVMTQINTRHLLVKGENKVICSLPMGMMAVPVEARSAQRLGSTTSQHRFAMIDGFLVRSITTTDGVLGLHAIHIGNK
jgi:hypothetical protein